MNVSRNDGSEDRHFYVDNAPPKEVEHVLRVLSTGSELTTAEIAELLQRSYGFEMQRDRGYSPRRLFDLGLAKQLRLRGKLYYQLTDRGRIVQNILSIDHPLAMDILHYLHYSGYQGNPSDRKLFWSYRRCCELIWFKMLAIPPSELAATILADMREKYPDLDFSRRVGVRFNSTAAAAITTWLRALEPSPVGRPSEPLRPREVDRHQLVLLALDDTFRNYGYSYGDPVLLDKDLVRTIAGVFFLDEACCRGLLQHPMVSSYVKLVDTLAGPAIILLKSISIEDV